MGPQPSSPRYVFAFDGDQTVSVNPPAERQAIPLAWVRTLGHSSSCAVYATGYQKLTDEADIPGIEELVDDHPTAEITPIDGGAQVNGYHPNRCERLNILADLYPVAEENVVSKSICDISVGLC